MMKLIPLHLLDLQRAGQQGTELDQDFRILQPIELQQDL